MWVPSSKLGTSTIALPLMTLTFSKVWLSTVTATFPVTSSGREIITVALVLSDITSMPILYSSTLDTTISSPTLELSSYL